MGSPRQPSAVRLIFEYEGDEVRLVSQQPVDVAVTGFDLTREHQPGHYVEVRGARDETLSRVRVPTEMVASAEVFPEEPGQPIVRVDLPQARGAFTVVVPAPEAADHMSVVRVPAVAPAPGEAAVRAGAPAAGEEIARFPLLGRSGGGVMTTSDGTVLSHTQIFGSAPRNRAFNVVLLAEGFTNAQQAAFDTACDNFVTALRAVPPYDELSPAINIFRVNVASTDSGADDPVATGGTGATRLCSPATSPRWTADGAPFGSTTSSTATPIGSSSCSCHTAGWSSPVRSARIGIRDQRPTSVHRSCGLPPNSAAHPSESEGGAGVVGPDVCFSDVAQGDRDAVVPGLPHYAVEGDADGGGLGGEAGPQAVPGVACDGKSGFVAE